MEIGDIIRKIRREKELTQGDLADRTGVSRSAIKMIETKRNKPSIELLHKIAEVFEVDPSVLLGEKEHEYKEEKINSFTMQLLERLVKENIVKDINNIQEEEMNLIISAIKLDLKRIQKSIT